MIYVLGGGQGKGPIKKGTIIVTYPAGATCTVTNGSVTYTALDTSGAAAFIVESGTWTVQAIDGTDTLSEVVEITTNGQIKEVELTNQISYLFKSGVGAVVPLTTYKEDSQCYINITTDTISKGWQSNNRVTSFSTENKIDLTDYYSLVIEYTCSDPSSGNYVEAFGISQVAAQGGTTNSILNTARVSLSSTTTKKIAILDITNYTGEYYVGVCGAGKSVIYNLWLVKPMYLYNAGDQYSSITGGWKVVNGGGGNSAIKSNYLLLSATSTAGDRESSIYTNNKVDTTGYSTLCAEMNITSKDTEYNQYGIWIGISNTNTVALETNYVKYTRKNTTGTQTVTVDLSDCQGEYYVKLAAGVAAANVTTVYLK